MAEFIMALIIFSMVALVMIIIGVWQIKSKNPVGFYTNEKPLRYDEVSDVATWNKKHGCMWVLYGLTMIVSFVLSSLVKSEILQMVLILCGTIGPMPFMMLYHRHLKNKYLIG